MQNLLGIINLNNDTNDRIIVTRAKRNSGKKFFIYKEMKKDGKMYGLGKNFSREQLDNGEVMRFLKKLAGNIPEEQMTWSDNLAEVQI